jgi:hypothetical protein
MVNKKIPTISEDRIIKTEINRTPRNSQDKRINALLKDKEPLSTTSVRIPEKIKEKLDKLSFYTKKMSMNDHIVEAIKSYLEDEQIKSKLSKVK